MKKSHLIIILLFILSAATVFRFWDLKNIPPGLYPDEAANGIDAIKNMEGRPWQVFYPANNGREGLFINIQTLAIENFGVHPWVLRGVSGIFGVAIVLGVFLLGQEIFSSAIIGLLAAFFSASNFWLVDFSRIGFRAILVPFFISWGLWWFFRGWRKKSWFDFTLSGIMSGLGFYSYISYRIVPLVYLLPFLLWLWQEIVAERLAVPSMTAIKEKTAWLWNFITKKKLWLFALWGLVASLIVMPLLVYFSRHPSEFLGRASEASITQSAHPLLALIWNAVKIAGMFNIYGDANWRHNISGAPELYWPVGILFLIGLALSIAALWKWWRKKSPPDNTLIAHATIIFGLGVMLVPTLLSSEAPHALRSLGAAPFVFLLVGSGAYATWHWLKNIFKNFPHKIKVLNIVLIVFLLIIMAAEWNLYFNVWAVRPEVSSEFRQDLVDIGTIFNGLPASYQKIALLNQGGVLVDNLPVQAQTIKFITYQKSNVIYLIPSDLAHFVPQTPTIILPIEDNAATLDALRSQFPTGHFVALSVSKGTTIVALVIVQ